MTASDRASRAPTSRPGRFLRRLGYCAAAGALLSTAGWYSLHHVPGFGPLAADLLRGLVGDTAVARAEDVAYGVQDRIQRFVRRGEAPRAHWKVEDEPTDRAEALDSEVVASDALVPSKADAEESEALERVFRPTDVGPLHEEQAAEGDGRWVRALAGSDVAYKTLLHPDERRSFSELFVVALDVAKLELHSAPGTLEPQNIAPGADQLARSGRVPESHMDRLFAAFNGGFKTRHGKFGMRTEGVTLVPPKPNSCTVAQYADGTLRIGTWHKLPDHDAIDWFRQTPGCMVEDGKRHPYLKDSKSWGATLDGDTVIRRSAIGSSADGSTLFVAISNATHAEALARGMQHVGAAFVAQLDVNHAYPRFLFYTDAEGSEAEKQITPLAEGFVVKDGHYVSHTSKRDFFYLTRKRAPSLARGESESGVVGG